MKTTLLSIFVAAMLFIASVNVFGNNAGNIEEPGKSANASGKVVDKNTGESLVGALVVVKGTDIRVYTDLDGNFLLPSLAPGAYTIEVSYISYNDTQVNNVVLNAGISTQVDISILPN
jgi:hypothetical protein